MATPFLRWGHPLCRTARPLPSRAALRPRGVAAVPPRAAGPFRPLQPLRHPLGLPAPALHRHIRLQSTGPKPPSPDATPPAAAGVEAEEFGWDKCVQYGGSGFAAGVFGSALGLGGGVLMVPIMVYLGMAQGRAHGTSLVAVAGTSAAGAVTYFTGIPPVPSPRTPAFLRGERLMSQWHWGWGCAGDPWRPRPKPSVGATKGRPELECVCGCYPLHTRREGGRETPPHHSSGEGEKGIPPPLWRVPHPHCTVPPWEAAGGHMVAEYPLLHTLGGGRGLARGPLASRPSTSRTLCGSERVLVMSTEPPEDMSCLTTPGVGCPGDGLLPVPLTRCTGGGGGALFAPKIHGSKARQFFGTLSFLLLRTAH